MHFTPMTIRRTFLHAGAALALCLGNSLVAADLSTTALAKPAPPTGHTLFTSVPINNSGVELPPVMPDPSDPLGFLYGSGFEYGGLAMGDVNADGRPDLFIAGSPGRSRLFLQNADFKFEDVTDAAGVNPGKAWGRGSSFADIDNDGDLDLYLAIHDAPNQLFINEGVSDSGLPKFRESAASYGLNLSDASLMPSFCDYDRDGDLDLYLLTNQFHWPGGAVPKDIIKLNNGRPYLEPKHAKYFQLVSAGKGKVTYKNLGRRDFLFRNDGNGRFTEVSKDSGLSLARGRGLSSTWWDYDGDGWLDLYVGNDWEDPDRLYRNQGDGTFKDVVKETVPHTTWFSMGSDIGDLNSDGIMDLFSADMSGTTHYKRKISMGSMNAEQNAFLVTARPPQYMRNAAFLGTGTKRVLEGAYLMGLANSDWSWCVKLRDFDNDGHCDVFITNGMAQNIVATETSDGGKPGADDLRKERNLAFRNDGHAHFSDVSKDWGIDYFGLSLASSCGDLDRDGDLDLIVINQDESPSIYRNGSTSNRCTVQLKGTLSNKHGLGSILTIKTATSTQTHQALLTRGYLGSDDPIITIGLGNAKQIKKLTVNWPSGQVSQFANITANQALVITEPSDKPTQTATPPSQPQFSRSDIFKQTPHRESPVDDFVREPLLPNKLSQLGPAIAVGDIDGDGDDDLAQGGARGQTTMLLLNNGKGGYDARSLSGTEAFEDMGLLWIDVDNDGDLDLYAVSGGVECSPGEPVLQDRLFLSEPGLRFRIAPQGTLPKMLDSGGPITAADFDRDGDMDIFVGSRVVPGAFTTTPTSHLLENIGGKFRDITQSHAKGLAKTGMVTSATFADIDNDGWQDLLVGHEWGPIKVFHNKDGKFVDQTTAAGLSKFTGWWNSLAAGDLDNDGDLDLVAGNFGHNTKYHATPEKPVMIFAGKFGTDHLQLVEAEYENDSLFPVRGRSCSTRAIPHLANKFTTFHDFALAEVNEIYEKEHFAQAQRHEVTTLDTAIFINDGNGKFTFKPLPHLAQIAPVYGITLTDLDGDGHRDIYLAQNFYNPQPETGRMAGGLSVWLRGDGKLGFKPVWPKESGLLVPDDAKSTVLTDINNDRVPDLVIGVNDSPPIVYLNRQKARHKIIGIRLAGQGLGARLTLKTKSGSTQTAEINAGGGYLSQSTTRRTFSIPKNDTITAVTVQWPNGTRRVYKDNLANDEIILRP